MIKYEYLLPPLLDEPLEVWEALSLLGNKEASIYLSMYEYINIVDLGSTVKEYVIIILNHLHNASDSSNLSWISEGFRVLFEMYRDSDYMKPIKAEANE